MLHNIATYSAKVYPSQLYTFNFFFIEYNYFQIDYNCVLKEKIKKSRAYLVSFCNGWHSHAGYSKPASSQLENDILGF